MNAKRKSADRIPVERFMALYVEAARKKQTLTEFAEEIGHKRDSVYIRVWGLRENLKSSGLELPELAKETKGSMDERAAAALRAALAGFGGPTPRTDMPKLARHPPAVSKVEEADVPKDAEDAAEGLEACEASVGSPSEDDAFLASLLGQ